VAPSPQAKRKVSESGQGPLGLDEAARSRLGANDALLLLLVSPSLSAQGTLRCRLKHKQQSISLAQSCAAWPACQVASSRSATAFPAADPRNRSRASAEPNPRHPRSRIIRGSLAGPIILKGCAKLPRAIYHRWRPLPPACSPTKRCWTKPARSLRKVGTRLRALLLARKPMGIPKQMTNLFCIFRRNCQSPRPSKTCSCVAAWTCVACRSLSPSPAMWI
jgi:hypothetical protein